MSFNSFKSSTKSSSESESEISVFRSFDVDASLAGSGRNFSKSSSERSETHQTVSQTVTSGITSFPPEIEFDETDSDSLENSAKLLPESRDSRSLSQSHSTTTTTKSVKSQVPVQTQAKILTDSNYVESENQVSEDGSPHQIPALTRTSSSRFASASRFPAPENSVDF